MTRPRVLVLGESLPFPTLKGGDLRNWQQVNALADFAEVAVFGLCSNDRRRDVVPDVPLAGWAAATDPALAYPPPTGVKLAARAWLLEPGGHPSDLYFSEDGAREVSRLLAEFRPAVVVGEGLWMHRYLDVVRATGVRTVLDCYNVEAAIARELAEVDQRPGLEGRVVRDVLPARTEDIERAAVRAADQVWVCSDADARRTRALYAPSTPPVVVPNAIRTSDYVLRPPRPAAAPLVVVFPGFFPHRPNAVAARFLVEEMFPRLARVAGDCRLVLVGAAPPEELLHAAAREPRIVVTGAVADVRPHLAEATVMAAPVFQGGGTRLKILEAFATGVPVISTPKGAEGLDVRDGVHLRFAETADAFTRAAVALWRDGGEAERLRTNARALVEDRYSWSVVGPIVRDAVTALAGGA